MSNTSDFIIENGVLQKIRCYRRGCCHSGESYRNKERNIYSVGIVGVLWDKLFTVLVYYLRVGSNSEIHTDNSISIIAKKTV